MAWTLLRASDAERLNRIPNWEKRGLLWWENRKLVCHKRVREADDGGQLRRAIEDLQVAQEAVRQLRERG